MLPTVKRPHLLSTLCTGLLLGVCLTAGAKPRHPKAPPPPQPFGARPAVVAFADELAATQGWDAAALREQLGQALDLPRVKQLILPAAKGTAKNWTAYRDASSSRKPRRTPDPSGPSTKQR